MHIYCNHEASIHWLISFCLFSDWSNDCLIKLWDTKQIFSEFSNIQSKNLKGHQSWVRCIRSHPKNSYVIASCGDDTTIRLWDIRNQKYYQVLGREIQDNEYLEKKQSDKRHTDPVRTLCFSDDGKYIASGGGDKKIIVWKQKKNTNSDLPEYEFFDSKPYIDQKSGSIDQKISSAEWVWSITFIGKEIVAVGGGSEEAAVLKVTKNGIVSSYDEHRHNFLSLRHKTPSRILKYHSETGRIASGGTDHMIKFCPNFVEKGYESEEKQKGTIRAMAFDPDGKTLATGGQDEHLYLWNVENGTLLYKKLLVNSPYVNVKLDSISGLSPEEIENISKLTSQKFF